MVIPGFFSESELKARFDERLEPARYAGNDDIMDLVFVGQRRGNKIKLFRRSGTSNLLYSAVFRGKIVSEDETASIKGYFTKSIIDYILSAIWLVFVYIIFESAKDRGSSMSHVHFLMGVSIVSVILLLRTSRKIKKKYLEILTDITGSRAENKDINS